MRLKSGQSMQLSQHKPRVKTQFNFHMELEMANATIQTEIVIPASAPPTPQNLHDIPEVSFNHLQWLLERGKEGWVVMH